MRVLIGKEDLVLVKKFQGPYAEGSYSDQDLFFLSELRKGNDYYCS